MEIFWSTACSQCAKENLRTTTKYVDEVYEVAFEILSGEISWRTEDDEEDEPVKTPIDWKATSDTFGFYSTKISHTDKLGAFNSCNAKMNLKW